MWRMLSIIQQQKMIFFYILCYKTSFFHVRFMLPRSLSCCCVCIKFISSICLLLVLLNIEKSFERRYFDDIFLIFFLTNWKRMKKKILIFKSNMSKMIKYEPLILTLSHGFTVIVIHFYVVNRYIYRSLFLWILFCVVPFLLSSGDAS